ncbi:DUF3237 domain-containing protein [Lysobacter soli]|uniref:DUF3237 domain-containing protein n=1 Tax=Lysobacter soli TaxID=453783 RepID=UPI0036BB4FB8
MTNTMPIRSRRLFAMQLSVNAFRMIGGPEGSALRIADVPGGTFTGERLQGIVLPDGTDWQTLRGDGAVMLDARVVLNTHDDALIAMTYRGIRHGPPEVMARLTSGEQVDGESYYFRITPVFQTSDPRYEWLNRIVAVGIGERLPEGPRYEVYEIL